MTSDTPSNSYDSHVRARMIDFFTLDGLPWPRRLWDGGSILALEELWEASTWARHRVLSPAAGDWQRHQLVKVVGPDIGLGDRDLRAQLRPAGGFLYRVRARDPFAAASSARDLVERVVARSAFMRSKRDRIRMADQLWVDGHSEPIPLAAPTRGADVLSLVKEGHLFKVEGPRTVIDDALELAAPVNHGALGPAVAGAWAAVESLLSHPDDPVEEERSGKAVAADRLAAIIACSWPRAELASLASRHQPPVPDDLALRLAACSTHRNRAFAVASALANGDTLTLGARFWRDSDVAAVHRMCRVITDPR